MASILSEGKQAYTTSTGAPLAGGKLYTYDAGTSTPRQTFSDAAGTVANANPVILDSRGEATIFWNGAYKVVLHDSADVAIWTVDGIATPDVAGAAAAVDSGIRADLANASVPAKGAGMSGFTVNAVGAAARTLYARGNDVIYLSDFAGVDNTGTTECSAALQAALTATRANGAPTNQGKILYWGRGTYKCSNGLRLGSSQTVIFEPGVMIDASGLPNESTSLFQASNQLGVYMEGNGALLKGARASAPVSQEGSSAAFFLYGSDNVALRNFQIQDFATDGITVTGDNTGSGPCTNVVIENCDVTNSRRNGLSIISAIGITVIGGSYRNSNGAPDGPWAGIDVEPNADCFMQGVQLVNVRTSGNSGAGVLLAPGSLSATDAASNLYEVLITGGRSEKDGAVNATNYPALSFGIGGAMVNQVYGQIKVNGFVVASPAGRGVSWYNWDADKCPRVLLEDVVVIDPDWSLNASTNANRTAFVVYCDAAQAVSSLGNIVMRNCLAQDRRSPPRMSWGFLLEVDAGKALKNVLIENPVVINAVNTLGFDVCAAAANVSNGASAVDITYTTPNPTVQSSNISLGTYLGKRVQASAPSLLWTLPTAANIKGGHFEVEALAGVTGLTITAASGELIKPNGGTAVPTYVVAAGDAVQLRSKGAKLWMLAPVV